MEVPVFFLKLFVLRFQLSLSAVYHGDVGNAKMQLNRTFGVLEAC